MLVSASGLATSFAWYSRTLRMRRGPSTNICTTNTTWKTPKSIWAPIEFEPYEIGEELLQVDVSDGSAHLEHQSEMSKLEARDTNKASTCGTWAEKDSHMRITSSPCKVKHVRCYQHLETVLDGRSCRWAESSQVTEVFYSNPGWKTQCEDLPNNVEYPINWDQKLGIAFICDSAYICTREYQLL
jgi:hypothetical protein